MRLTLGLLFLGLNSYACLNLTGNWSGDCIYSSPSFGHLNGSIEFHIRQPNCDQIAFDGNPMKIPGTLEQKNVEGSTVDYVKLTASWKDSSQSILNFNYIRTTDEKGQRVDDVALDGTFEQKDSHLLLKQKGVVDHDHVEIQCLLAK